VEPRWWEICVLILRGGTEKKLTSGGSCGAAVAPLRFKFGSGGLLS
jgi:hypothetical protein